MFTYAFVISIVIAISYMTVNVALSLHELKMTKKYHLENNLPFWNKAILYIIKHSYQDFIVLVGCCIAVWYSQLFIVFIMPFGVLFMISDIKKIMTTSTGIIKL